MPMIELSDEDEALLEAAKRAGGMQGLDLAVRAKALHDRLYSHKETAVAYQKAIKTAFPDAKVAADVAEPFIAPINDRLAPIEEFISNFNKEREEGAKAKAQADFDAAWNDTVKEHGLTEEGQEKLLNFMKDRRLSDPEAAALLYYKRNPKPAAPVRPESVAPQTWGMEAMGIGGGADEAESKALIADPDAWADREAAAVLTEIRGQAA